MDEYKLVEYAGLDRPEYIWKNDKPLNIYGSKKILEAQQAEIEALKAHLDLIKSKWDDAAGDIHSLFNQQPINMSDGGFLVDGQACHELGAAIVGNQQGDKNESIKRT